MVKKYEWYPADDAKNPKARKHPSKDGAKLRKGLEPGRVLILLAGRFRGKRVVCLKQLKSGLLCVTGPFKVNGVPVRRVNQAYTMTTSSSVSIGDVKSISDDTFKKEAAKKRSRSQRFFAEKAPKTSVTDARKKVQKDVDGPIMTNLKKDAMMKKYLGARFSLGSGDAPHAMKF
jgi:large subunit ribosomal protein L6e